MRFTTIAVLLATLPLLAVAPVPDDDEVDPRWLQRMDDLDRELLDANIGHAPPGFTDDLEWLNGDALTWEELRGRVVLVQSFTTRQTSQVGIPVRLGRRFDDVSPDDLVIIALHTPEEHGGAQEYLARRPMKMPVVLDRVGRFCDQFGIFREPANVIIDRNGVVRHAGLNGRGLVTAVRELIEEEADPSVTPEPRPADESPETPDDLFPRPSGGVGLATDIRGQHAPEFRVRQWLTAAPNLENRVVIVDFWATWCRPCRESIPHMNKLARDFGDSVAIVGISDEDSGAFQGGLREHRLSLSSFRYALALDPNRQMYGAVGIRGIPHAIVMSRDWIVRWQGHPASLNAETLRAIVEADEKLGGGSQRYRWTG